MNSAQIQDMSSQSDIEATKESHRSEHVDVVDVKEKGTGDVLANPDVMHDAFDGEAREHDMTLWDAVQTYPMACFWAFIMCFTIVSATLALPSTCPDPRPEGGLRCKACVYGTNLG